ncbi:Cannabidiolic acid synthase-like protein [Cladobotryum mycophilum]|uniref:Cannabidiolic acid synthase-like protein n=1 Tax=Cladobotryum mycophilum TaxID=491253 RepID=A0ABR0SXB2_9HYPO
MDTAIEIFQSEDIPVFKPGEVEYERSVATANLLYRFARPGCVVQPARASQVETIVKVAKAWRVPITIKNGGHSYAGFSTTDAGISLDLIKMNKVKLDMDSKTVILQGGAQWGHAYKQLINGHHDGYIINGGRCPTVGVSGFILGGGLSPFTRSFGMGCDTLREATIITANGERVTVKDSDDPMSDKGRLFWALCGAGGGNFGVVVELKMNVSRLQNKEGKVVAGRCTWFPNPGDMDEFMDTMNRFYSTDWPDQLTIDTSWLCDLQQTKTELGVRFLTYYDGNKDDFETLIDKSIRQPILANQLKRRSLAEKSTRFLHETLVSQWSEEIIKSFPTNRSYSIYSSFVFKNDHERIRNITSIIRQEMSAFRELFTGEQALLQVTWIHGGGQASKMQRSDTAFRWRDGVYHTYIMIQWDEKWLERDMRGFLQKFKENLRPFSIMRRATFINFPDQTLSKNAYERAYYGNNTKELQQVKKIWDRDNFFSWAQGVRLPPSERAALRRASTNSARMQRMERYSIASIESDVAEMDMNDPEAEMALVTMAADDDSSDEETQMDEQDLTDMIAAQQWETVELPAQNAFVGRIQALTDLGY